MGTGPASAALETFFVFEVRVKNRDGSCEWVLQPGKFATYGAANDAARANARYPFRVTKKTEYV